MTDNRKTKEQLIQELEDIRRRNAELEKSETELKLAEDALIQNEERYRSILDNTQEGYYEVDLAGNFTFVNDAECNDLGYTREELIGMNYKQYTTETTAKKEYELFNRVYRTREQIKGFEGEFIKKNGTKGFNEISVSVIRNKEGKPVGFRGLSRDITERKRAEEVLSRSEEKYRVLFEGSRHGILTADIETGRFIDANPSICRMFGYSNTEWPQLNMADLNPKDFLDQAISEFKSQLRGEKKLTSALPCLRKDGTVFYADISSALQIIHGRKYAVRFFADVTDRKLAESALQQAHDGLEQGVAARTEELRQANEKLQAEIIERERTEKDLKQSEEKFKFLAEKMGDIVWVVDLDFRTSYVSPSVKNVLGFTPEERKLQTLEEMLTPESFRRVQVKFLEELQQEEKQTTDPERSIIIEVEYYHKDGSTIWMENIVKALRDPAGVMVGIYGVSRDITERKQAQEALRVSETRYRLLAENARDVIWTVGMDMRLTYVSPSVTRLLGFTKEEAMERTMQQAYTQASFVKAMQIFDEEMAIESAGHSDPARSRILELDLVHKDGTTIPVEGNFCFLHDSKNKVIGILSILRDITDRKRAEEIIRASLREKETLLKEIHHRVKNNLAVISSLLGLQSRFLKDEKSREMFQKSQDRVRVMANIHTLLYQSEDLSRVDFGGFIRDLAGRLQQAYGTATPPIEIHVDIADVSLTIETSIPCGLVLNELVSNALKHAFPEGRGGEVHIGLTTAGDRYVLTVQDNGIGFPEAVDFQKTKSLGLELVNLFVGQINGTIDLTVDDGTKFTITFPMTNNKD